MNIEDKLKEQIKENNILIYMKGTPYEPRCGFSAKTIQALIECDSKSFLMSVIFVNISDGLGKLLNELMD